MPKIEFFVNGTPKAQPRARAFAVGGSARVYDPGTAEGWKGLIALAAKPLVPPEPMEGPVWCELDFYFPRPQRLCRKKDPDGPIRHTAKPDRDNLEKAVTDCLKTLRFYKDDAQVCDGPVRKWYVARGGAPGVRISLDMLHAAYGEDKEDA